jgi:putative PIN family toxin of toxin-antitoxin system
MIYLQADARSQNPANKCFDLVRQGIIELYLSKETLAEIEDVFTRAKFRNRFPSLSDEMIEAFLAEIKNKTEILENVPLRFSFARDPKDEKYINLAVAAEADYIVSRDKDLLDLMSGYTDDCKEFRQRFRPLKIVEPLEFLPDRLPLLFFQRNLENLFVILNLKSVNR